MSGGKGDKGGNFVAFRSVPGLGPLDPCHAPAVPGEWLGSEAGYAGVVPVTSECVPRK